MTTAPEYANTVRSKVVVNSQFIDMTITSGSEPSLLHLTAFIVKLQPKTATQVYKETGSMLNLTRDTDFSTSVNTLGQDSGYGAYLNTSRFKIIKRLEFETQGSPGATLGNTAAGSNDTGSGTRTLSCRRQQFKLNYGQTVMSSTGNGASSSTLTYDEIDPRHKHFIIIISNDSTVDGESPSLTFNSLISGYACE